MGGAALILALLLAAAPALAAEFTGPAQVKDADSIVVRGRELRLHGIDAPEWNQACKLEDGAEWHPGREAAAWLASLIEGKEIACHQVDYDRKWKRPVVTCYADGQNINRLAVRHGWAFAYRRYSTRYVTDEQAAKAEAKGLWRGTCDAPEAWRVRN